MQNKCIILDSDSLQKGDQGGSKKHCLETGIALGIKEMDFMGSFTMSPFW